VCCSHCQTSFVTGGYKGSGSVTMSYMSGSFNKQDEIYPPTNVGKDLQGHSLSRSCKNAWPCSNGYLQYHSWTVSLGNEKTLDYNIRMIYGLTLWLSGRIERDKERDCNPCKDKWEIVGGVHTMMQLIITG